MAGVVDAPDNGIGASFHEAGETLKAFTGLELEERSLRRLVNRLAPDLKEAEATLQARDSAKSIPVPYIENDGTGVPGRAAELAGRRGQNPVAEEEIRREALVKDWGHSCASCNWRRWSRDRCSITRTFRRSRASRSRQ